MAKKTVRLSESKLIDLIDKIVTEAVSIKKNTVIKEQKEVKKPVKRVKIKESELVDMIDKIVNEAMSMNKMVKENEISDNEKEKIAKNYLDEYYEYFNKNESVFSSADDKGSVSYEFVLDIPTSDYDNDISYLKNQIKRDFRNSYGVGGNPGGRVTKYSFSPIKKIGDIYRVTIYVSNQFDI